MRTSILILKEIRHSLFNFLLSLLAVAAAVALFVFFLATGDASERETSRLMRDLGFNLRIIAASTEMDDFWRKGYSEKTMPEEYVQRFADQKGIAYNHLLATLRRTIEWRGSEVVLVGLTTEVLPPGKKKSPMIFAVEEGTVHVGFEIARRHGIAKGDTIEIRGRSFRVAETQIQEGSDNDITIHGSLADVQGLLGLEGKINEIRALECLCRDPDNESIDLLREQLERILPDAKVIQIRNIARARERQRLMTEGTFGLLAPFLILVCAAWVGILAMINVRNRQQEIGIMRALGFGSGRVAALFIGKAVAIGLVGAAAGFFVGTFFSLKLGPDLFEVTAKAIEPAYDMLGWSLLAAPVFTALSSLVPTMVAVTRDPAAVLKED